MFQPHIKSNHTSKFSAFIHISTNSIPNLQSFQKFPPKSDQVPQNPFPNIPPSNKIHPRGIQVPYFVSHIECPFGEVRAGLPAREIRAFTNGFVVGGDESCIAVWRCAQRTEDEDTDDMI